MDNDAIHKFAYRHREMVADLLRIAVPALAAELDLAAAKEVSAAHVGHRAGALEQRYGDMIWRVPFKTGRLKDGTRPYLLVLLEFQVLSGPEHAQAHAELRPHAARTPRRRWRRRARRRPALAAAAGALQRQRTLDGHGLRCGAGGGTVDDGAASACPLPARRLCSVLNGTVAGSPPQLGAVAAGEPRRGDDAAAVGPNAQSDRAAAANGVGPGFRVPATTPPGGYCTLGHKRWSRTRRKRMALCRRCRRSKSLQDERRKR